mmetsp:Transcript_19618/g.29489  ORF Transcript_19618/g.29489 Transcript_19618/m.29489 type:complete len:157 (-) Transcript_19618:259-729(-)
MVTVIKTGLSQWFNETIPSFPSIENIPNYPISNTDPILPLLKLAFDDQTLLGWGNLLKGRVARSWFTAHDKYCEICHLSNTYFSSTTGPFMIKSILDSSLALWIERNQALHGKDHEENLQIRTDAADKKTKWYYKNQDLFTESDCTILLPPTLQKH